MARGIALAAALAASLLAVAGAGGSEAQAPRVGGTVVYGGPFGEPACLSPLRDECAPGSTALTLGFIGGKVLEGPFDVGPGLTWRPRLVSSVTFTTRPPFTLTYHIRPEARWSDGVPITAADFVFTHQAILRSRPEDVHKTKVRSVRALDSKTVEVVLRSRFAAWRELFGSRPAAPCARGRRFGPRLDGPDRESEDGCADRERALPRRALGARQADHAPPKPPLLGASSCLPGPARRSLPGSGPRAPRSVPAG